MADPGANGRVAGAQPRPRAMRDALRSARTSKRGSFASDVSDSPSEEDYDDYANPSPDTMVIRRRKTGPRDAEGDTDKAAARSPLKESEVQSSGTDSATQPSDQRLTAKVIFVERDGSQDQNLSTTATAVSSFDGEGLPATADADGDGSPQRPPPHRVVVNIDNTTISKILKDDLGHLLEDIEDRNTAETAPLDTSKDGSSRRSVVVGADATLTSEKTKKRKYRKFGDYVFTRGWSAFDRQNEQAKQSPFHGFFTLFWIGVFMFMVKIAADNWRSTGSPLGTNEIMQNMFHRDVVVLLVSDGVLCALTGVSWLIQLVVFDGRIMTWNGAGWYVQHIWQTLYVAGFIYWPRYRDWTWSHTVFFVLHGLVMLMKQHSYAFYNGYLSDMHRKREIVKKAFVKLHETERVPASTVSSPVGDADAGSDAAPPTGHAALTATNLDQQTETGLAAPEYDLKLTTSATSSTVSATVNKVIAALETGEPLDQAQAAVYERILQWELDGTTEELRGRATRVEKVYPNNLTFTNHYEYIVLPTLVYELEYPRSEVIDWSYAAEKFVAVFGIIFAMIVISQAFMYPVVMRALAMKEAGMPLGERFKEFPWMLSDLVFPFMMEYLLTWYLIWETILNFLAEVTYFADRSFYAAWWNSVTWDEFAREWNRPVHLFLLRHVYHSTISAMRLSRNTATLVTFFLSACVHELVMWCIFRKLRGYLLFLQMMQLPLVSLSRTRWLRHRKTLGNIMFWVGIFMGPTTLCSLYLIL